MEKQTLKKIITIFILVIAVISAITLVSIQMNKPNGTTLSEREELLREYRNCKRMNIATELQLDNYVLCGIYDENKSGIAIFESSGNGYKLQRTTLREQSRVITASEYLNEEWYQLVWFHGVETETAEIVIINTCGFIESAKQEAIGLIRPKNMPQVYRDEREKFLGDMSYEDCVLRGREHA